MNLVFPYLKATAKAFLAHPRLGTVYDCLHYFPQWKKYNEPGRTSLTEKIPWMNFGAIRFLEKRLRPEMRLFEFGSGGSTLFWASRVGSVVSVEHDRQWYESVRHQLPDTGVEFLLAEPEADPDFARKNFRDPDDYVSHDLHYEGMNFARYARTIDRYPEAFFDIIVVDGRARPACIKHAIPRLKTGGLMVIDDTYRDFYLAPFVWDKRHWAARRFVGPIPFGRPFFETTILLKTREV
ncbi:MAG TPA: hypothetical protein VG605_12465 [Puia sp.]|nr:hypothetical protein [Puia sp.]